jgi:hypothetical protein
MAKTVPMARWLFGAALAGCAALATLIVGAELGWWASHVKSAGNSIVVASTLSFLAGAFVQDRFQVKEKRRLAATRCASCGYPRDGLAPDTKCPECGTTPTPPAK